MVNLPHKFGLIFMGMKQKKIQNGRLKKSSFFKIANSQNFFTKISQMDIYIRKVCHFQNIFNFIFCTWKHEKTKFWKNKKPPPPRLEPTPSPTPPLKHHRHAAFMKMADKKWKSMERPSFLWNCSLSLLQNLRSLKNWLLKRLK